MLRPATPRAGSSASRVFLLSPAHCAGERMALLLRPGAASELALALQSRTGAALGEVFQFASGLYFRGKLAYARAFGRPSRGVPGALVIAPGFGLIGPDQRIRIADLRRLASVPVDPADPRYREPLERDVAVLAEHVSPAAEVVLLGSIASGKYVDVLLDALGDRLRFPAAFVGRGDMSRGGLMLRCARSGAELEYVPVAGAIRHGPRPPRLPRLDRTSSVAARSPTRAR